MKTLITAGILAAAMAIPAHAQNRAQDFETVRKFCFETAGPIIESVAYAYHKDGVPKRASVTAVAVMLVAYELTDDAFAKFFGAAIDHDVYSRPRYAPGDENVAKSEANIAKTSATDRCMKTFF